MNNISAININQSEEMILNDLIKNKIEVGMLEFNLNPTIVSVPESFKKIGNFELDIIAIEKSSKQIVMLDHDDPSHIMAVKAKDLAHFVDACKPISIFFNMCEENPDLCDDDDLIRTISIKASGIAETEEDHSYDMFFGI